MISLFIDTSNSDVVIGLLENGKLIEKETRSILNEHSKYAVSIIDEVLKKANISTDSVDEILVVNGPGSFTGIRIGLTISKVYAYLTNIKVVKIKIIIPIITSKILICPNTKRDGAKIADINGTKDNTLIKAAPSKRLPLPTNHPPPKKFKKMGV